MKEISPKLIIFNSFLLFYAKDRLHFLKISFFVLMAEKLNVCFGIFLNQILYYYYIIKYFCFKLLK
ncbi:hypothetical protein B0A67_08375 [Flavobacterium aquidurense]|nr:hypothetical protein B0A67_08375 [Flavobacterium aquidurense]